MSLYGMDRAIRHSVRRSRTVGRGCFSGHTKTDYSGQLDRSRRGRGLRRLIGFICVVLICFALFGLVDNAIRPTAVTCMRTAAQTKATTLMEEAAGETMQEMGLTYEDFCHLGRSTDGSVTDLSLDNVVCTGFKSSLTKKVSALLADTARSSVSLPLGSLTHSVLLSGRGPEITFRLVEASALQVELHHTFESAGWNQTLHRVWVRCSAQLYATVPIGKPVTISSDTVLCETVLAGKIPQSGWLSGQVMSG